MFKLRNKVILKYMAATHLKKKRAGKVSGTNKEEHFATN